MNAPDLEPTPAGATDATDADEAFMRMALAEAARAADAGEVPVGALIVAGGRVIGRGHNLRERSQDPTSHAEMVALRAAAARLACWRLLDATCYVTLEPCPMCAGALVHARVARVVYGCDDPKAGALRSLYRLGEDSRLNHRFETRAGVLADECAAALSSFFAAIRAGRRGR
ncbi:MAG: tRNA adenosine(34) deaminase TadA [Myxococcales bacterium]|nr:tRNA adenosine(34) deaminase TadA [Myxococcales bacterium]